MEILVRTRALSAPASADMRARVRDDRRTRAEAVGDVMAAGEPVCRIEEPA